jgi:DNA-directed RNA polymerase subunit alpha
MSILAFQMPDKVVMEKADDFQGLFEFKPLEKGYGITIGNALRRILLSSLEGYAITGIKIPGVVHEFSSIEGVVEDVSEIILNLKTVRFKKVVDELEAKTVVNIPLKGVTEFNAGIIGNYTNDFEILNPDFVICTLDAKADVELEITIEKGRGYLPAEENKPSEQIFFYSY